MQRPLISASIEPLMWHSARTQRTKKKGAVSSVSMVGTPNTSPQPSTVNRLQVMIRVTWCTTKVRSSATRCLKQHDTKRGIRSRGLTFSNCDNRGHTEICRA